MLKPKISIIIVCYNSGKTIEETLKSIINQTYRNRELIIIDGLSKDNTLEIIKKYNDNIDLLVSEKDSGIYDAMNKGLKLAKGEWVIFMNTGDSFYDNSSLESIIERANPYDDVIYGNSVIHYNNSLFIVCPKPLKSIENNGLPFCHQCVLVKNSTLKKYSIIFDLNYKYVADYKMFYTLYSLGCKFSYHNVNVAIYDITDGLTANNKRKCLKEQYSVINRKPSFLMELKWIATSVINKALPDYFVKKIKNKKYNNKFIKISNKI